MELSSHTVSIPCSLDTLISAILISQSCPQPITMSLLPPFMAITNTDLVGEDLDPSFGNDSTKMYWSGGVSYSRIFTYHPLNWRVYGKGFLQISHWTTFHWYSTVVWEWVLIFFYVSIQCLRQSTWIKPCVPLQSHGFIKGLFESTIVFSIQILQGGISSPSSIYTGFEGLLIGAKYDFSLISIWISI